MIAMRLVPFHEPAWRLGLVSVLFGGITVGMTYLTARRLGAARPWSVAGAATVAFSYTLWQQSTKVETYTLNAAFIVTLLWLALNVREKPTVPRFLLLATCAGFALTNHLTIVWFAPALLFLSVPPMARALPRTVFAACIALAVIGCLAPLSLYGYEIAAARSHPGGQVWGDTTNLHLLWLHATGSEYHRYFMALTLRQMAHRDFVWAPIWLWRNMGLMLVCAVIGFVKLIRESERKQQAIGILIGIVGYIVCNTVYGIANIFEYYTGVVVLLGVFAARGLDAVASTVLADVDRQAAHRVTAIVVAVAVAAPLIGHYPACNRREALFVSKLADNILYPLPQNAVLVTDGDNRLFPLWYAQDVLGHRRDVLVVPLSACSDLNSAKVRELNLWYYRKLQKSDPSIDVDGIYARLRLDPKYASSDRPFWDIIQREQSTGRPIYLSNGGNAPCYHDKNGNTITNCLGSPEMEVPDGLSLRLTPLGHAPSGTLGETALAMRNLEIERSMSLEYVSPQLLSDEPDGLYVNYIYAWLLTKDAKLLEKCGDYPDAYPRLKIASTALNPGDPDCLNALAISCIMTQRQGEAIEAWKNAVRLAPGDPSYRHNLVIALAQRKPVN
jgi:uncharacterized membrane protein/tetratricopeptide (TPR) repeat protein